MKKTIALLSLGLGLSLINPSFGLTTEIPLQEVPITPTELTQLGLDEQLWNAKGDKQALIKAIDHSLYYLNTSKGRDDYQNYQIEGISRERVYNSLVRFRQLLVESRNAQELQNAVSKEFIFYKSVGDRDTGKVIFTGYYEPIYEASRVQTAEFRYPLYRKPKNLEQLKTTPRLDLEGKDGLLGKESPLHGYELVWLKDRFRAFLVQVQGSARLQLTDGTTMTIGYDGSTDFPYTSIGKELVKDGKQPSEGLTLPILISYFQQYPQELDAYLPRNERFVFFKETNGAPARGSIGVPVTAERSIATDKSIMPPGALALIYTRMPYYNQKGELTTPFVSRYVLDQDTGSAIKGPGRVDIFMGSGKLAGDRAGVIGWEGDLYYLLLKK
jgi:membrane-bound lytic murein transglycosylase A